MRSLVALFVAILVLAFSPRAQAATVKLTPDASVVGVGDRMALHVVVTASTQANVTASELEGKGTDHIQVTKPTQSMSQNVSITNGVMTRSITVDITYTVVAKSAGNVTLTAHVTVDGKVIASGPTTFKVVPRGQAPASIPQQQRDPFGNLWQQFGMPGFDPFGSSSGGGVDPFGQPHDFQPSVPLTSKLALPAARGQLAFLHAIVDKTSAVVGEQVGFSVYLYVDPNGREPDFNDAHEATAPSFLKQNLIDDTKDQALEYASVGGDIWLVKRLRSWALFPLKTGNLEIGPMRLAVSGARSGGSVRSSEPLVVHVEEPPLAGRPPGYVSGDVGSFELEAEVAPKTVEQGGAISVDVTLSGQGNLPSSVTPPPQKGIEWLPPEVHETMSAGKDGIYGGSRRFTFVAHMNKAGAVDLGEIALPFYDPAKKAYEVARATLGTITVKPNPSGVQSAQADEILAGLPPLRDGLANAPPRKHLTDHPVLLFFALAFSPLAFVFAAGGRNLGRRLRARASTRHASPEAILAKRTNEAKAAGKNGDARALDAAVVKMLEQATIVRAEVNVRALSIDEIEDALVVRGIGRDVAHDLVEILRGCEESRFVPEAGSIEASRERLAHALAAVADLGKRKEKS